MSKEKVFIVISHMTSLKNKVIRGKEPEWEVTETVEFVNQLRKKHINMSSAIGDYLNRKMISGTRYGIDDYDKFEEYIRTKYSKQIEELDAAYRSEQEPKVEHVDVFTDQFGNVRERTVFDVA